MPREQRNGEVLPLRQALGNVDLDFEVAVGLDVLDVRVVLRVVLGDKRPDGFVPLDRRMGDGLGPLVGFVLTLIDFDGDCGRAVPR